MPNIISVSLRSRFKLITFLIVISLPCLLLAAESARIAWAAHLGKSSQIAEMKRAVSLDPVNPDLHFRLGTAEVYDLENPGLPQGIQQLLLASQLSPRETRYWEALASACEFEGDQKCAGRAIEKSLALSPMAPRIHWEAANYYLWANQQEQAFGEFRRLLELDPGYAAAAFRSALGAAGDPKVVYRALLKTDSRPQLKLAYVNFLASQGREDVALQFWKELVAGKPRLSFSAADVYLEHLIAGRNYDKALSVWNDRESLGLIRQSDQSYGLVFNGGFEYPPMNAGFDWRYQQAPYVAINFQGHEPFEGKHCLQLSFSDVENHQEEPVYEIVPVNPEQTYVLTAEVRSNNIVSGSGPQIRVIDPECRECLNASSGEIVGTTPWHEVRLTFRTGPHTTAVRISVWRARSLGYPTEILGTLWLDQVTLKPTATAFSAAAGERRSF